MPELPNYRYRGARALVSLHDQHLRRFLDTWRIAKLTDVELPQTEDPTYASLETLLGHVLNCARHYMVWMCEVLELPDPEIEEQPEAEAVEDEAEVYLEHVLERWRSPLAEVPEERFHRPSHTSKWDVEYCVDAMLEHAAMHPIRHRFQLQELMGRR